MRTVYTDTQIYRSLKIHTETYIFIHTDAQIDTLTHRKGK